MPIYIKIAINIITILWTLLVIIKNKEGVRSGFYPRWLVTTGYIFCIAIVLASFTVWL